MVYGSKKNLLKNGFLLFYFLLFFINIIMRLSIIKYAIYAIGISCSFYYSTYLIQGKLKFKFSFFVTFIFLLITGLISLFINHNLSLLSYIILFSYLGISILFLRTKFILELSYIPFILNSGYLIFYFLLHKSLVGAFAEQSVNYVSITILYSLIFIYVAQYQNNKANNNYLLILVGIFLSVLAGGRGGCISLALLFGLTYMNSFFHPTKNEIVINIFVLVSIVSLLFYYLIVVGDIFALLGSGFSERGMDSNGRTLIWGLYLFKCLSNPKSFLFGVPIEEAIPIEIFPHLHNSYLMNYANFGLLCFLVLLIIYVKIFFVLKKYDLHISFLYLAILERAVTDIVFSNFDGDIFIIYFILLYLFSRKILVLDNKEFQKFK